MSTDRPIIRNVLFYFNTQFLSYLNSAVSFNLFAFSAQFTQLNWNFIFIFGLKKLYNIQMSNRSSSFVFVSMFVYI